MVKKAIEKEIGNKEKRVEVKRKNKLEKNAERKLERLKRKREAEDFGVEKLVPQTIESKRQPDETIVEADDIEITEADSVDEFAKFWSGEKEAKIMITTRPRPSKHLFSFMTDLLQMIPNMHYHPRKSRELKEMSAWATKYKFTHFIVLGERAKVCNRMLLSLLPNGPTAQFKVSSITLSKQIEGHGKPTQHYPEIVLNNFSTRLGHRLGRFFGTLFPKKAEFQGRTVVTFHNQRDFIFVRHHRYAFRSDFSAADLQELGPKFTLKLRWLSRHTKNFGENQDNALETVHAEYEFVKSKDSKNVKLNKESSLGGKKFAL